MSRFVVSLPLSRAAMLAVVVAGAATAAERAGPTSADFLATWNLDRAARLEVVIHWDDAPAYRFCGLWSRTPSENFYCLEPWTSLPNAFSRPDDGELQVLQPGDVFRAAMWMEVRAC